jgi:hypothetical protein
MKRNYWTLRRTVALIFAVFSVLFFLAAIERELTGKPFPGAFGLAALLLVGAILLFAVDLVFPRD